MIIVRYADDFIVGFQHENDARRFLNALRERLGEFALSLHSEKTRLIEFGRFAAENRKRRGLGKPETFNFLGFTFICSKTRQDKFQIKRKSRRDRMRAKLKKLRTNCGGGCISRSQSKGNGWRRSCPVTSTTMQCRPTFVHCQHSAIMSAICGGVRSRDAATRTRRLLSG